MLIRSLQDHTWIAYNTSKSAVLQMGRSLACELGPKRIRVNTLSPGHIYTAYAFANVNAVLYMYSRTEIGNV